MVDFIFNFINFAARIGLVVYVVRKYLVRSISNAISYQQESIKLLEDKYQDIKLQSQQIEKNIHSQEQLYFDLQKKFSIWKNVIDQEQVQFEKTCLEREATTRALFERKRKNIEQKSLLKQELPIVLAQLQKDIQLQIAKDQQLGKDYMQNILTHVSKE